MYKEKILYYEYTTQDNDRWDLVAEKYYKNPLHIEPIIVANPEITLISDWRVGTDENGENEVLIDRYYYDIPEVLPSGVKIRVPVVDKTVPEPKKELPPWKR